MSGRESKCAACAGNADLRRLCAGRSTADDRAIVLRLMRRGQWVAAKDAIAACGTRELEATVRNQRHELRRLSEQRPPGNHGAHDCCEHQTEAREMRMNVAHVCETLADDGWVRVDYVLTAADTDGGWDVSGCHTGGDCVAAHARIRELEAEVDTSANCIRGLEVEVKRLQVANGRLQVANGRILIEKDELANAAAGKIDSANATLERVRAALNVKSYDTDPYSDVRVVDVEDLREALGEPGESADAT